MSRADVPPFGVTASAFSDSGRGATLEIRPVLSVLPRHASCLAWTEEVRMLTSRRRPLLAAAFLLLFFGIGVSSASAAWSSRGARFHGRFFAPRTRAFVHARPFSHRRFFVHRPFFHRRFFAPRFAFRPFHRPFRLVRVFVYDPFPRWVFRRVYYDAPYGYYGAYSDPYYYPY